MVPKILVTACLCAGLSACQGSPPPDPKVDVREPERQLSAPSAPARTLHGLHDVLHRAEMHSPAVSAAFQDWQAALAQVDIDGTLPNPWLNLGGYLQSVETRNGPMDGSIGIQQRLPWPGSLDAERRQALEAAEAMRWQLEQVRLQVRQEVLQLWAEGVFLEAEQELRRQQLELWLQVEQVTMARYRSSMAEQAEVLRVQVERLHMEDRLAESATRTAPLLARLQAVLGSEALEEIPWRGDELRWTWAQGREETESLLLDRSPHLLALQSRLRAAQAWREVAEKKGMPDFSLGVDWTWIGEGNVTSPDAGNDALALRFGIELPLQRSEVRGLRHQSLAAEASVRHQIRELRGRLSAELQGAWSQLEDSTRRRKLFDQELLPKVATTFTTTLAAYENGRAGFQEVLEISRLQLEMRISAERARTDAALAVAALHSLIPGLQTEEVAP